MYTESITVTTENIIGILSVADYFQIDEVKQRLQSSRKKRVKQI